MHVNAQRRLANRNYRKYIQRYTCSICVVCIGLKIKSSDSALACYRQRKMLWRD